MVTCPSISTFEIRDHVDCIISSMCIESDFDFKIAWNCSSAPVEQMYVGATSILHSDATMNIDLCFNTCLLNYNVPDLDDYL